MAQPTDLAPPLLELAPPSSARPEEEEEEEEGGGGAGTPPGSGGAAYRPGSQHCPKCLITFPDPAFAARHAKRQHPRDFAAALRGSLFVCFVCGRAFGSSPALLRHQRGHAHQGAEHREAAPAPRKATPLWECRECGRGFAREGALHRHYIRHARGEL
ncbi:zinc finger protein 576-like [Zonotrichia leucophrys gambelii]|uniref:zinc finger protein 576-like n=1 Tax=Zonotrichia leucophrys gambelii TaxID=257770 RepID=UPI00314030AC